MSTEDDYRALFEKLKIDLESEISGRVKWLGYFFHITDITNAAAILTAGSLLCRSRAILESQMTHENAELSIIQNTSEEVREFVRLYFRPRTPTFYHNEGFKTREQLARSKYRAHCPVPVALIFDAAKILTLDGVRYSDGNLAAKSYWPIRERTFSGIKDLETLPYKHIYHDGSLNYNDPDRDIIIYHRHAEIVVPGQLPLDNNLVAIRCRSDAELQTLRTLLSPQRWKQYRPITNVNSDGSLFYATRYFIERVWIKEGSLNILVHKLDSISADYFSAQIRIDYFDSEETVVEFELEPFVGPLIKTKPDFIRPSEHQVTVSIYLDGHLAYKGRHWTYNPILVGPI